MRGQPWYEVPEWPPIMTIRQLPVVEGMGRDPGGLARDLEGTYRRQIASPSEANPGRPVAPTS
jgi:hypothetical protein